MRKYLKLSVGYLWNIGYMLEYILKLPKYMSKHISKDSIISTTGFSWSSTPGFSWTEKNLCPILQKFH